MIDALIHGAHYARAKSMEADAVIRLEVQPDGVKVYGLRSVEGEPLPAASHKLVGYPEFRHSALNPLIGAIDAVSLELERCASATSSSPPLPSA